MLETLKRLWSDKDTFIHYYIHFVKQQQHKEETTLDNIFNKARLTIGYETEFSLCSPKAFKQLIKAAGWENKMVTSSHVQNFQQKKPFL